MPHLDITIFYHDEKRPGHNWAVPFQNANFPYRRLSCVKFYFHTRGGDVWPRHFPVGLLKVLVSGGFDIIVCLNWTEIYTLFCLIYGKLTQTPVILWEDSIPRPPSRLKRFLAPAIRRMFGAYDAMVAMSSKCKNYLIEWGGKPHAVFLSSYSIDNNLFPNDSNESLFLRERLNHILGLGDSKVVLFVGQFILRKGIIELLDAFRKLVITHGNVILLMVGDGPMRRQIEAFAADNGLLGRIVLPGYVRQKDLSSYYARSDVFVLPSHYETFGVVICEAMACGLPVITTEMVGAAPDLVKDGVNGFVVPPGNIGALHCALDEILRDKNRRLRMAEASQTMIAEWTIDKAVNGFCQAIEYSLDSLKKRS